MRSHNPLGGSDSATRGHRPLTDAPAARAPNAGASAAWPWAGGLALLAVFGWFAFVRGARVPVLGWIDLAIHEFGHVITIPLPELVTMVMGSGMQIMLPLFLAGVFAFRERDPLGAALCLGWSATSMQDASVYIADAPSQQLQLIGGLHDWAYALDRLGAMHHAAGLARLVWTLGLLSLICAFAACGWGLVARPRRPQGMTGRAGSDSATALAARTAESAELGAFTSPATGSPERLGAGAGPDDGYFAGGGPPRSG